MSFPPPITGLKLRISTGADSYEQPIPSASMNGNSFQIMPNTVVFNAFNNNPAGTIFTPSMVTSYGSDQFGNAVSVVSTPSVIPNFVARKIIPTLYIASIPNKLTTDSPFYLSVTTNSTGVLSYSSSATSVATVNSSSGLVTIVGAGTTTITVNLATSANRVYAAATITIQLSITEFSVITDSDFDGLDFDSGMTTLSSSGITVPNFNFISNSVANLISIEFKDSGITPWYTFAPENPPEFVNGPSNRMPVATFRPFSLDQVNAGSYKFVSNDTRLLIKLSGYKIGDESKTFTTKLIIEESGDIKVNYTSNINDYNHYSLLNRIPLISVWSH